LLPIGIAYGTAEPVDPPPTASTDAPAVNDTTADPPTEETSSGRQLLSMFGDTLQGAMAVFDVGG